ncbi:MAG: peptidylprolyl isomerase [Polyangiales bacterium]
MRRQHRFTLPTLVAIFAALAAPSAARAQPHDAGARHDAGRSAAEEARRAQVVARINSTTITVGEFEDLLNDAPAPIRQTYADPARRREYLDNLVMTFLLADEARRRGLDRDPQVSQTVRRILGQRVEQVAILEAITPDRITDAEVRQWYDAHLEDYQQPEYRRATVIITPDRAAAQRVIDETRRLRGDLRRVRELVREVSVDEDSKRRDGDFFYFQRTGISSAGDGPRLEAPLADAVFSLAREMDVTPQPVALADNRFGVAVLTGVRPALRRGLDDVGVVNSIRGFITRERRAQRREELLRELRARIHPEVHEDRLDAIHLPAPDLGALPPFGPAGSTADAGVNRR